MGSLRVDNCTNTDNDGFCYAEGRSLERYSYFVTTLVIMSVCVTVYVNGEDFSSFLITQDIRCGA